MSTPSVPAINMIAVNSSTSFTIVRMNGCTALSSRDRPSIRSVAFRISLMSTPQTTSKMAAEISFVHEKPPKKPTVEAVPSSSAAPTALAASLTAAAASGASFVKNSTYAPSVGFGFSSVLSAASSAGAASASDASASSFGASSLRFSAFT